MTAKKEKAKEKVENEKELTNYTTNGVPDNRLTENTGNSTDTRVTGYRSTD